MEEKFIVIILSIYYVFINVQGTFYLTEKYYCKKYFKKDKTKCKAWSCRFYEQCHNEKDE